MNEPTKDLIAPIVSWVEAVDDAKILDAPEDFLVGYGAVHRSIARLLQSGDASHAPSLFVALAACEFVLAEHPDFTKKRDIPPIAPLPADWLGLLDDDSAEFRLAASLSSLRPSGFNDKGFSDNGSDETTRRVRPFRTHLEPVDYQVDETSSSTLSWDFGVRSKEVVWDKESDVDGLNAIFARRLKLWEAAPEGFLEGAVYASLRDIQRFVTGDTDEAKLSRLCFSLSLVDTWRLDHSPFAVDAETEIDAAYALARLCYSGHPRGAEAGGELPLNRDIHLLANRGDLETALEFAGAHLRKHGYQVGAEGVSSQADSRRVAAALLFPIADAARQALAEAVELH